MLNVVPCIRVSNDLSCGKVSFVCRPDNYYLKKTNKQTHKQKHTVYVLFCYSRWAQGYSGAPAHYINSDTIAFQCGNCIKFISDDGQESVFAPRGQGIGVFAVHSINKVFAIADTSIKSDICIYQYPSFREIAKLEGEHMLILQRTLVP